MGIFQLARINKHKQGMPITIALDIDDTLLGTDRFDPDHVDNNQTPIGDVVQRVKYIRSRGIRVVLFTSRKSHLREATVAQLRRAGIDYDDIVFDKPFFDVLLDNKAMKFEGAWDSESTEALIAEAFENRRIDMERYPTFF